MEVVEYPLWRIALEKILNIFEQSGYDVEFTHKELKGWMGITEPTKVEQVQQSQLDYLSGLDKLKRELLEGSNLCLFRVCGKGYKILHPTDQVRQGVDAYIKRSQRNLSKAAQTIVNVDADKLDIESRNIQLTKMNRIGFIKESFRKRKLPYRDVKIIEA